MLQESFQVLDVIDKLVCVVLYVSCKLIPLHKKIQQSFLARKSFNLSSFSFEASCSQDPNFLSPGTKHIASYA